MENLIDFLKELDENEENQTEMRVLEIPMKDIIQLNKAIEYNRRKWDGYFNRSALMAERYDAK